MPQTAAQLQRSGPRGFVNPYLEKAQLPVWHFAAVNLQYRCSGAANLNALSPKAPVAMEVRERMSKSSHHNIEEISFIRSHSQELSHSLLAP